MYDIYGAPVPNLGNQTFLFTVGNVVGGGSYVNGMQFDRGADADYDAWAELGNEGWGWSGLQLYFKKSNDFDAPSQEITKKFGITYEDDAYGDGPLKVSIPDYQFPDTKTIFHSWDEVDIPHSKEGFNEPVSVYWSPNSINKKTTTRSTSRSAYYDPIASRKNLKLLTNTHVDEITFEKNRIGALVAAGVRYTPRQMNKQTEVFAAKEVILAASGVFTPHLLMYSGTGPKDVLADACIVVKKDHPAVGSNFQDHVANYMNFDLQGLNPENQGALNTNSTFNQTFYDEYLKDRSGPYSVGKAQGLVFIALKHFDSAFKQTVSKIRSQVATNFLPPRYSSNKSLLAGLEKQREILAHQVSEADAALGELWNTFQNPIDAGVMVALTKFNRKHWASKELAMYKPVKTAPGPQYPTDEETIQGSIEQGTLQPTFAHPSGGCSMMPERLGGCVSNELLVYGVHKLSIVDASIIPVIPAAHLQATTYAIAEKAADIIKKRA